VCQVALMRLMDASVPRGCLGHGGSRDRLHTQEFDPLQNFPPNGRSWRDLNELRATLKFRDREADGTSYQEVGRSPPKQRPTLTAGTSSSTSRCTGRLRRLRPCTNRSPRRRSVPRISSRHTQEGREKTRDGVGVRRTSTSRNFFSNVMTDVACRMANYFSGRRVLCQATLPRAEHSTASYLGCGWPEENF
jgi:hypothetical protein